jgi:hypothetical protein
MTSLFHATALAALLAITGHAAAQEANSTPSEQQRLQDLERKERKQRQWRASDERAMRSLCDGCFEKRSGGGRSSQPADPFAPLPDVDDFASPDPEL